MSQLLHLHRLSLPQSSLRFRYPPLHSRRAASSPTKTTESTVFRPLTVSRSRITCKFSQSGEILPLIVFFFPIHSKSSYWILSKYLNVQWNHHTLNCDNFVNNSFDLSIQSMESSYTVKCKCSDITPQFELSKAQDTQKPQKRANGIFWIILINLGIYVADHFFQVLNMWLVFRYPYST